ncbi:hypothetical protein DL768_006549 [Monosporascus sp. mg162]|nr:hypothetical protein DL768_006549 [Monosporascus sp. mg162]
MLDNKDKSQSPFNSSSAARIQNGWFDRNINTSDMDALSPSSLAVAAQPKSILKKSLKVQTSKKCAVVDGVARDIVTGEEIPQSAVDGASSKALEKRQRHEEGQALLRAQVERNSQ